MSDLIDREALLRQIDIDSEGEPGYYGDTWKFIDTIKSMPPAELSTNLAEVGTDTISRRAAIDAVYKCTDIFVGDMPVMVVKADAYEALAQLPSAQPEPCEDTYGYIAIETLLAFCENSKDHAVTPNDFMRMKRVRKPEPCEDAVPRASVEYICRKNTVSTNPYEHEYYEKFIKFMDDPEIADFGRWQHSNGFNTALVAVKCDLDKVPSVTPKQRTGKWIKTARWRNVYKCDQCGNYLDFSGVNAGRGDANFCPNCGSRNEVTT